MRNRRAGFDRKLTIEEYRKAFERAYNARVRPRMITRMKESTQRRIGKLLKFTGWLVNRRTR